MGHAAPHAPATYPSVCPYCGSNYFRNAWGRDGNAECIDCGKLFVVSFRNGRVVGLPIPESGT